MDQIIPPSIVEYEARVTYVIQEQDTDCFKVGVTRTKTTFVRRLQNLATGNPREFNVLFLFYHDAKGDAYLLEQYLLWLFKENRVRDTEWIVGRTKYDIRQAVEEIQYAR